MRGRDSNRAAQRSRAVALELGQTDTVSTAVCTFCGVVNVFPGMSVI